MPHRIEPHRLFLAEFVATGGTVTFSVQLFGRENIGDQINAENLMGLGRMGIGLRVEILPEWP